MNEGHCLGSRVVLLKSGQDHLPEFGAAIFFCALDRDEVSVRLPQYENEEVVHKYLSISKLFREVSEHVLGFLQVVVLLRSVEAFEAVGRCDPSKACGFGEFLVAPVAVVHQQEDPLDVWKLDCEPRWNSQSKGAFQPGPIRIDVEFSWGVRGALDLHGRGLKRCVLTTCENPG